MTGTMHREEREQHWKSKRVFFMTGETVNMDISMHGTPRPNCRTGSNCCRYIEWVTDVIPFEGVFFPGICPLEDIVCVVVDEAHRATGQYSYVPVVRQVPF